MAEINSYNGGVEWFRTARLFVDIGELLKFMGLGRLGSIIIEQAFYLASCAERHVGKGA